MDTKDSKPSKDRPTDRTKEVLFHHQESEQACAEIRSDERFEACNDEIYFPKTSND